MKERLKGLLALCLVAVMLLAAVPGVALAEEAEEVDGEDITFHDTNALVFADRLYPGDVLVGNSRYRWPAGYGGSGSPFFIARYISKEALTPQEQQELQSQVFEKGLMQESDFRGIYRYWDMPWADYSVLCERITRDNEKPVYQFVPDAEKTCLPGYEYLTYAWDEGFPLVPEADNPRVTCFDKTFNNNESIYSQFYYHGLQLPSVDQLFGSEYALGYHYAAKRLSSKDWVSVSAENPKNIPSGIVQAMEDAGIGSIIVDGVVMQYYRAKRLMDGVLFDTPFLFDENMDYGTERSSEQVMDAIVLEPAANRYTIKFDANGGSGTMADLSLTYTPGSKLPANAFTKAGYTFAGWKIQSCTYYRSEERPAIVADISKAPYQALYENEACYIPGNDQETVILEAQWTPKAYTVSFDTAGGTEIDNISIGWDDVVLENVENPEKEGFVFAGWTFNGDSVAEDDLLSDLIDDDTLTGITLTANWDEIITVSVPFTTEVKLGDTGKPGETAFDLAIVQASMSEEHYAHVTVSGTLTTNGAGNYDGTLTLTGPSLELQDMLCEGAIVQQVNGGKANWTYDDTVWGLLLYDGAMYAGLNDEQEQVPAMQINIYPATCEKTEDGPYYDLDWEAVYAYQPVDKMTFTNTYTAHEYALNHDTDGHWDECPCGDVQNQEAHKFGEWTETKAPTHSVKGEKERVCSVCDYTETAEIPMLEKNEPPKTDVPQTGDNSHMALWLALILVSGGALIGTAVYGKKRKYSAK